MACALCVHGRVLTDMKREVVSCEQELVCTPGHKKKKRSAESKMQNIKLSMILTTSDWSEKKQNLKKGRGAVCFFYRLFLKVNCWGGKNARNWKTHLYSLLVWKDKIMSRFNPSL